MYYLFFLLALMMNFTSRADSNSTLELGDIKMGIIGDGNRGQVIIGHPVGNSTLTLGGIKTADGNVTVRCDKVEQVLVGKDSEMSLSLPNTNSLSCQEKRP